MNKSDRWIRREPSAIFNLSGKPFDSRSQIYSKFGLTAKGILVELYKRYQGLDGWYLVNMAERKYYYCGAITQDVQEKLYELGINHRIIVKLALKPTSVASFRRWSVNQNSCPS